MHARDARAAKKVTPDYASFPDSTANASSGMQLDGAYLGTNIKRSKARKEEISSGQSTLFIFLGTDPIKAAKIKAQQKIFACTSRRVHAICTSNDPALGEGPITNAKLGIKKTPSRVTSASPTLSGQGYTSSVSTPITQQPTRNISAAASAESHPLVPAEQEHTDTAISLKEFNENIENYVKNLNAQFIKLKDDYTAINKKILAHRNIETTLTYDQVNALKIEAKQLIYALQTLFNKATTIKQWLNDISNVAKMVGLQVNLLDFTAHASQNQAIISKISKQIETIFASLHPNSISYLKTAPHIVSALNDIAIQRNDKPQEGLTSTTNETSSALIINVGSLDSLLDGITTFANNIPTKFYRKLSEELRVDILANLLFNRCQTENLENHLKFICASIMIHNPEVVAFLPALQAVLLACINNNLRSKYKIKKEKTLGAEKGDSIPQQYSIVDDVTNQVTKIHDNPDTRKFLSVFFASERDGGGLVNPQFLLNQLEQIRGNTQYPGYIKMLALLYSYQEIIEKTVQFIEIPDILCTNQFASFQTVFSNTNLLNVEKVRDKFKNITTESDLNSLLYTTSNEEQQEYGIDKRKSPEKQELLEDFREYLLGKSLKNTLGNFLDFLECGDLKQKIRGTVENLYGAIHARVSLSIFPDNPLIYDVIQIITRRLYAKAVEKVIKENHYTDNKGLFEFAILYKFAGMVKDESQSLTLLKERIATINNDPVKLYIATRLKHQPSLNPSSEGLPQNLYASLSQISHSTPTAAAPNPDSGLSNDILVTQQERMSSQEISIEQSLSKLEEEVFSIVYDDSFIRENEKHRFEEIYSSCKTLINEIQDMLTGNTEEQKNVRRGDGASGKAHELIARTLMLQDLTEDSDATELDRCAKIGKLYELYSKSCAPNTLNRYVKYYTNTSRIIPQKTP